MNSVHCSLPCVQSFLWSFAKASCSAFPRPAEAATPEGELLYVWQETRARSGAQEGTRNDKVNELYMEGRVSVLSPNYEQRGKDGMGMFFWNFVLNMRKCRVVILAKDIAWLFPVKTSKQFVSTGTVVVIQNKLPL